jgi:hypothetical protein
MYPSTVFLFLTLLITNVLFFPHSACSLFCLREAYAGDVQYVYDDLGRLSAVVNPTTNEAALYQYDAVGNLLGIVRQPASTLAILNFTPKSGPVGTTVTVAGLGFSTTASQNTVTFNGVPTTVSSATATQLVVTVPSGATTGPIAVTTPSGAATSSTPFTVTSGSATALPTITSFTPTVGAPGTPVTISGSNFATPALDNRIVFHTAQAATSSATATSLTTSVPAAATSGPLSITTPAGSGVSAADFFVPPAPYTAAAVAVTARLTFGQSQTVTLSTANTIALLLINASAGHRIGVNITNVTLSASTVSITNPYGQVVASAAVTTAGAFVESPLLTISGTYTVTVIPDGTATGSMTLMPYDIVDLTGAITSGTAMTLNLATPGQNALLTFTATAGQRVSVLVTNSTIGACTSGRFSFREPDGTPLVKVNNNVYTEVGGTPCTNTFMDAEVLSQSGTSTFMVDPAAANTGQITLTLNVFSDLTSTVTYGVAIPLTFTIPGQDARLTFSHPTGQRVFVAVNTSTLSSPTGNCSASAVTLQRADGTTSSTTACPGAFLDTATISTAGTSTVWINPGGLSTGQVSVTVHEVPADLSDTIAPGTATTSTISAIGQNAALTFARTAGQRASVVINSSTISNGQLRLLKPDGTSLASVGLTGFLDAVTLPVTGPYTLVVDPTGVNTGQATLTLHFFTDVTGSLTLNATATPVSLPIPGQRALLTFAGTATQQVTVRLTANTIGSISVSLLKPDTTVQISTSSSAVSFILPQQTLATTGTYTVQLDPTGTRTGTSTVQVTSP